MMPRLTVDIDDVLADFVGGMKVRFGNPEHRVLSPLCQTWPDVDYDTLFHDDEFHLSLRPIPLSQHGLQSLSKTHEIYYISARPPSLLSITLKWLSLHSYPESFTYCLGERDKANFLSWHTTDIIVDDMPHYLVAAYAPMKLLFEREWNEMDTTFRHVYDWLRIVEIISYE